jgi:hypothetical protein
MSRSIRRSALALLAAAALGAAGCGSGTGEQTTTGETGAATIAETEGTYLPLGGMKYQIQMSRYLNPHDIEDQDYLLGLPQGVEPSGDEVWFGIWMRVENTSEQARPAASEYEISDTQDNVYRPVPIDTSANVFAYDPTEVQPGGVLPAPNSAPGSGPIQGSLLLFKIKNDSLQNRPMVLKISQGGQSVGVDIDV